MHDSLSKAEVLQVGLSEDMCQKTNSNRCDEKQMLIWNWNWHKEFIQFKKNDEQWSYSIELKWNLLRIFTKNQN